VVPYDNEDDDDNNEYVNYWMRMRIRDEDSDVHSDKAVDDSLCTLRAEFMRDLTNSELSRFLRGKRTRAALEATMVERRAAW
jgi:hypothetical protein